MGSSKEDLALKPFNSMTEEILLLRVGSVKR